MESLKGLSLMLLIVLSLGMVSAVWWNPFTWFAAEDPGTPWIIEGDSVYINDSLVYINITPHTSNHPVIEFESKVYSGPVDIVFGFDTDRVRPTYAKTNPRIERVSKSFTCDYDFNYTLSPNYMTCFREVTAEHNGVNETTTEIVFEGPFDSGNLGTKTIFWEEEEEVWTDISGSFNAVNYEFMGNDKWFYREGITINQDQRYKLKVGLRPNSLNEPSYKYFFGIKPSGETLAEAIANDHFYFIDPWTEDLNTDLVAYWKLDEPSGTIYDSTANDIDSTSTSGVTLGVTGKIENATDYDGSDDYIRFGNVADLDFDMNDPFTVSLWFNPDSTSVSHSFISKQASSSPWDGWSVGWDASDRLTWEMNGQTGAITTRATEALSTGTWYHLVFTYAGTGKGGNVNMWVDAVNETSLSLADDSLASFTGTSENVQIGARGSSLIQDVNGQIDEMAVWSRVLTSSEISDLYNGGSGITWEEVSGSTDDSPSVVLSSPSNDTTINTPEQTFQATVTDDQAVANVTLYIDGIANETNSSGINGSYSFTKQLNVGAHNWSILAYDNASQTNQSETRLITYTDLAPDLVLNSPVDTLNTTSSSVTFQATATDDSGIANVTLYVNGVLNETNSSGINGSYSFTKSFEEGNHNWSILTSNINGVENQSTTRTFTYQEIAPTVTLISPEDSANITSSSVSFSVNVTDDEGVLNVTLYIDGIANETDTSGTNGTYNFNKNVAEGEHNWSILVYDDAGKSTQSATRTFNYTQIPVFVELISPVDDYNSSSNNVNVTCRGYSDVGVVQLNLTIDGSLNQTTTNSTPSQNLTISSIVSFAEGSHDWNCSTTTGEGVAESSIRTLTIDTTAPTFTLAPSGASMIFTQTLQEFFSASDAGVGVDTFSVNNTDFTINSTGYLTNATSLSIGNYSLLISVNDTLGNTNTATYALEVQPKTIVVSLDSPSDGGTSGTTTINFSCSAELQGGGDLENVSLYTNKTSTWQIASSKDIQKSLAYDDFSTSLSTNLTAFYKVDDDDLTDSENSYDLTNGGSTNTTGVLNSGRAMDGVNDYLRIPSSAINSDISISIWFKANETSGATAQYLYHGCTGSSSCSDGSVEIWIELDQIKARIRGEASYPTTTFTDTTNWHNVIFTHDGSQECLYLDGELISCSGVSTSRVTTGFKNFGALKTDIISTNFFNGTLDEMAIWSSALNSTQVREVVLNRTTANETIDFNINGSTLWNCYFCEEDGSCAFSASNYTVGLDSTGPTISVAKPTGTISSGVVGLPEDYEATFTDTNLESCWYEYQGANYSIDGCLSGIANASTFILQAGSLEMTFYANDSSGNLASNTTTWEYFINDIGIDYSEPIYEGVPNTIIQTLSVAGGELIDDAWLDYNGTNYTTTITFASGNYNLTTTAPAPDVSVSQNVSFRFYVEIDGSVYDLREAYQQVLPLNFSSCDSGDVLLNLSLFDEEARTPLNGTIEANMDLTSTVTGAVVESILYSGSTINNVLFCLDPINATQYFYLDAEIRYESTDYAAEFYFIQNADLTSYPYNISLFDLNSNDTTEFLVKYQDSDQLKVEGAVVQLLRKYISTDETEVVEAPLTSNLGEVVVHVDLDTQRYGAIVSKEGVVLDMFDNIVFNCENELSGDCEHDLFGEIDAQNSAPITQIEDFAYSVSEVNNTVTTTFSIPSGLPSSVNVVLTQRDVFGNATSCNQTIISSAGSVDCTYNATIGDSFLDLEIYKDGVPMASPSYIVPEESGLDFQASEYFIFLIIFLSLVGMAFTSSEAMMINAFISLVLGGGLWLLGGMHIVAGLGILIYLIVAIVIILRDMAKQEDQ